MNRQQRKLLRDALTSNKSLSVPHLYSLKWPLRPHTHRLTRGWSKNNEEWIPWVGLLDKITANCYHRSRVRERVMVKGVEQGLLLGVVGSRTNLAQQPHRGDTVHSGSNWSYPLLACTLALLAIQPQGTARTEKQARWLVFKEYRERQQASVKQYSTMEPRKIFKRKCLNIWVLQIPAWLS